MLKQSLVKSLTCIYRAEFILTLDESKPFFKDGAIVVQDEKIVAVGFFKDLILTYPDFLLQEIQGLLMPGLLNSHCHLELSSLQGQLKMQTCFVDWILQLQKITQNYQSKDWELSVAKGVQDAICSGTTHMIDVGNKGVGFSYAKEKLQGLYYLEMIGLNYSKGIENWRRQKNNLIKQESLLGSNNSATAHAPFSCSSTLLKKLVTYNDYRKLPFVMHLAESKEEQKLFEEHSGDLFDFCQKIEPNFVVNLSDKMSVFDYLIKNKTIPNKSVMVHCNTITKDALAYFAKKNISIVHCPSSHEFFDHPTFPYDNCLQYGVNVVLGTDSLASNSSLSLFKEMQKFKKVYSKVDSKKIVSMVTKCSASVWNSPYYSGQIKVGDYLNIIGVDISNRNISLENIWDILVNQDCQWFLSIVKNQQFLKI